VARARAARAGVGRRGPELAQVAHGIAPDSLGFSAAWRVLFPALMRTSELFGQATAHALARVTECRFLARALAEHGASRGLVRRLRRAARVKARHARALGELARRMGAELAPTSRSRGKPRPSLGDLAARVAREGVVRETFGALLAAWQAEHAEDRDVRDVMRVVAAEDAELAGLSWEVARWLDARVSPEDRARARDARDRALAELAREIDHLRELPRAAGLPSGDDARALFGCATRHLFAA